MVIDKTKCPGHYNQQKVSPIESSATYGNGKSLVNVHNIVPQFIDFKFDKPTNEPIRGGICPTLVLMGFHQWLNLIF